MYIYYINNKVYKTIPVKAENFYKNKNNNHI